MKRIIMAAAMLANGMLFAQSTTWVFGDQAKMKMTNGVVSLPGGFSSMITNEGCASVVDNANNIVMYTDGSQVFNGAHLLQASGLGGSSSSTQSALIVPIPGQSCQAFYIFTTAAAETDYGGTNGTTGLRVSRATISGAYPYTVTIAVAEKNINLFSGSNAGDLVAEKLCVTADGNGGYWVATHGVGTYTTAWAGPLNTGGENKFYAVNVNAATTTIPLLAATMVTTTLAGNPHRSATHPAPGAGPANYNGQGQMKFNAPGTKVAMALTYKKEVQIYDFSISTGLFSNAVILNSTTTAFDRTGVTDCTVYGVEWAYTNANPAQSLLYVSTTYQNNVGTARCTIYQFETSSGVAATISGTRYTVFAEPTGINYFFGALQMAPDGRIFIARNLATNLDAINTPGVQNAGCGYAAASIPISGMACRLGLPTVVVYNPCEGNPNPWSGHCPECTGTISQVVGYVYDIGGTGSLSLTLSSGVPIKNLKVYIANYNLQTSSACQNCVSANTPTYGTFTSANTIAGTSGKLTPYSAAVPVPAYSREVTYAFPAPVLLSNQTVWFNFIFPPALTTTGCYNRILANIKVEYTDVNCVVCEKQIYIALQSATAGDDGGGGDGRLQNPDGLQDIDKGMQLTPNPASNDLTIRLINLKDAGLLEIVNAQGEVVQSERNPGDNVVIDTGTFANGVYLVRYTTGNSEYVQKLIIQH